MKKVFKICEALLFLFFIFSSVAYSAVVSTDFYFLSATGKYIMQTKTIPTENPFFVHDGLPLIVQQWMYCIYCGILSNYGNIGTAISILALESVLIFVIYKLFRLRNIEKHISFWLSILSVFVAINYIRKSQSFSDI